MDEPLRLSFSSVETYQQCPRRFELTRLQRVPRAPIAALIGGTAVHTALEADGQLRLLDETIGEADLLDRYDAALDATARAEDPAGLVSDQLPALRRQGHATLRAYVAQVQAAYHPIAVETGFEVDLAADLRFSGRIDAITAPYIAEENRTVRTIIDFKTASAPWTAKKLTQADQAAAYLLGQERLGTPAERVTFIVFAYAIASETVQVQKLPTRRPPIAITNYIAQVQSTAASIRTNLVDGDFPARVTPQCARCPCLNFCPDGKAWLRAMRIEPQVLGVSL